MVLSLLVSVLLVIWALALGYIFIQMKTFTEEKKNNFSNIISIVLYFPALLGFILTSLKVNFFNFGYQLFFKMAIAFSLILYAIFRGYSLLKKGTSAGVDRLKED